MAPDEIQRLLRYLKIVFGQTKVYLLGGEPTLHPAFFDVLRVCREEGYWVSVTSNGLFLQDLWSALPEGLVNEWAFSIDGSCRDTHELLRGKGTFDHTVSNILNAVEREHTVRLVYTVTSQNKGEVEPLIDMFAGRGIRAISFHYFSPIGLGGSNTDLLLSPGDWTDFYRELKSISLGGVGVSLYCPPTFVSNDDLPDIVRRGYRGCVARNFERLAIFPDKRIYLCSAFLDTDLHYGEFKDGAIRSRGDFGSARESALILTLPERCLSCKNAAMCRGGCMAWHNSLQINMMDLCNRQLIPLCPLWSIAIDGNNEPAKTPKVMAGKDAGLYEVF